MVTNTFPSTFESLAQRVVFSYLKMMAALPEGADASQRDLHAFFQTVYETMVQAPDLFGLPPDADINLPRQGERDLQEANRKLAKPRGQLEMGIDFLMAAGKAGVLEGHYLALTAEAFTRCQAKPKVVRKFINGLVHAGLEIEEAGEKVILRSTRYPAMMPALQSLAQACSQYEDPLQGRFLFARCDFGALQPGYQPEATDLYRMFDPQDTAHLMELHDFFTKQGYKAVVGFGRMFAWEIKYQGSSKIKATPLYQVEYQERFTSQLRVHIKCASANRITDMVAKQSAALQDDFFKRSLRCRGKECDWCASRKGMGPSALEYHGETFSVCWYVPSDVNELTDASVALIKEYALMHQDLLN